LYLYRLYDHNKCGTTHHFGKRCEVNACNVGMS
jgi:hypothetical protein